MSKLHQVMPRYKQSLLVAFLLALSAFNSAFASPPKNNAVANGANGQQGVCIRGVGSCYAKEHGRVKSDTGGKSTYSSDGFASWDQLTWSTDEQISAAPDTNLFQVSGSGETKGFHVKFTIPGAHANSLTSVHFTLTMTGVDPVMTGDQGDTTVEWHVADNKQDLTGLFYQKNGIYQEDGFSNVSITNVGDTTVNFAGDFPVKGKNADLYFLFELSQSLGLAGVVNGTDNVSASGSALVQMTITPVGGKL